VPKVYAMKYPHQITDTGLLEQVTRLQQKRLSQIKSIPRGGVYITYEGKKFLSHAGVFGPFEDSKALVRNWVIRENESVLDVGTGSGILSIFAALKGTRKVVALDTNQAAVENAKANAVLHGVERTVDVRSSDLFNALNKNESFDVIIANLPFREKFATDVVEQSMWDTDFKVNKRFFDEVGNYLRVGGRIYFAHSNFGNLDSVFSLAERGDYTVQFIGENTMPHGDLRVFYALEIKRR